MSVNKLPEYGVSGWLTGSAVNEQLYDIIKDYPEGNCTFEIDPSIVGKILLNDVNIDQNNMRLREEALKSYMNVPRLVRLPYEKKKKSNFKKQKQRNKKKIKKKHKKKWKRAQ